MEPTTNVKKRTIRSSEVSCWALSCLIYLLRYDRLRPDIPKPDTLLSYTHQPPAPERLPFLQSYRIKIGLIQPMSSSPGQTCTEIHEF